MALEFRYQPRDAGAPVDTVTVDQHWYLTEDKNRVVPEGDPAARWLWATPGMEVPRAEAVKLGALSSNPADEDDDTEQEPAPETVKEKPAPADKQRAKPGDKKASRPDDVAELRKQAADLGMQVDNRWGVDRLRREITAVQAGGEG